MSTDKAKAIMFLKKTPKLKILNHDLSYIMDHGSSVCFGFLCGSGGCGHESSYVDEESKGLMYQASFEELPEESAGYG